MKKLNLFSISLALILLFSSLVPTTAFASSEAQNVVAAASPNSILTITNKSIAMVTVTLTGPRSYTFYAQVGKMTQEILKGTYKYSYQACGLKFSGTLKATAAKSRLPIAACKTTNLVILNFTDATVTLSLVGPATYYYTIPPHSSVRAKILRGTYSWSGVCNGRSSSGTWVMNKARFLVWCR
jgi:hypothetical protein